MNLVFEHSTLQKTAIFNVLRKHFNVLRNFIISTSNVLRNTSIFQCAAEILIPTQCTSKRCSTAALLSLKYLYIYICTYMHVCIGVSIDRRLKCCAPAPRRSDGLLLAGAR